MSPRKFTVQASGSLQSTVRRLWVAAGIEIREARLRRHWSLKRLACAAGVSAAVAYRAEAGEPTSVEAVSRLIHALGLRLEFALTIRGGETARHGPRDLVHSAMGEFEARHLRELGRPVGVDEP
jgi:transcriptional regulator with XRE-family HTH domain